MATSFKMCIFAWAFGMIDTFEICKKAKSRSLCLNILKENTQLIKTLNLFLDFHSELHYSVPKFS
jgi:hypothetical protein